MVDGSGVVVSLGLEICVGAALTTTWVAAPAVDSISGVGVRAAVGLAWTTVGVAVGVALGVGVAVGSGLAVGVEVGVASGLPQAASRNRIATETLIRGRYSAIRMPLL